MPRKVLSSLNLNLLVALDALLVESNVTRAAQRCGVSQSAMSQSLAQLRVVLDDPLLVRASGGMVRTPRADGMRADLSRVLAEIARLMSDQPRFDPLVTTRRIRIGSEDVVATLLLGKLMPLLEREAPSMDVDFVAFSGAADVDRLQTGELEFAMDVGLPTRSGLRSAELFGDDLVAVVRRGHPAVADGLDLETYCELPHLIVGTVATHVVSVVDRSLARVGRSRRVALRLRYFNAAPGVVASSSLIWNGPRRLAVHFQQWLPLEIFPIPVPLDGYVVRLYWHARFEKDPAHAWVRERLLRCLRDKPHGAE